MSDEKSGKTDMSAKETAQFTFPYPGEKNRHKPKLITVSEEELTALVDSCRQNAELGSAEAQYQLGLCYRYGSGVRRNKKEAARLYQLSAEQGFAAAQFALSICYYLGTGVPEDTKKRLYWLHRAGESQSPDALYELGRTYQLGKAGIPINIKKAMDFFRQAANLGDGWAQFRLGECYAAGSGGLKDDKEAVRLYRLAAEQGVPDAQYKLSNCYLLGRGETEDHKEALRWCRLAANQGLAVAECHLGIYYNEGVTGVLDKDSKEAVRWWRLAADQGNPTAQLSLGHCYILGRGVEKNLNEAARYFWLASLSEETKKKAQAALEKYKLSSLLPAVMESRMEQAYTLTLKKIASKNPKDRQNIQTELDKLFLQKEEKEKVAIFEAKALKLNDTLKEHDFPQVLIEMIQAYMYFDEKESFATKMKQSFQDFKSRWGFTGSSNNNPASTSTQPQAEPTEEKEKKEVKEPAVPNASIPSAPSYSISLDDNKDRSLLENDEEREAVNPDWLRFQNEPTVQPSAPDFFPPKQYSSLFDDEVEDIESVNPDWLKFQNESTVKPSAPNFFSSKEYSSLFDDEVDVNLDWLKHNPSFFSSSNSAPENKLEVKKLQPKNQQSMKLVYDDEENIYGLDTSTMKATTIEEMVKSPEMMARLSEAHKDKVFAYLLKNDPGGEWQKNYFVDRVENLEELEPGEQPKGKADVFQMGSV